VGRVATSSSIASGPLGRLYGLGNRGCGRALTVAFAVEAAVVVVPFSLSDPVEESVESGLRCCCGGGLTTELEEVDAPPPSTDIIRRCRICCMFCTFSLLCAFSLPLLLLLFVVVVPVAPVADIGKGLLGLLPPPLGGGLRPDNGEGDDADTDADAPAPRKALPPLPGLDPVLVPVPADLGLAATLLDHLSLRSRLDRCGLYGLLPPPPPLPLPPELTGGGPPTPTWKRGGVDVSGAAAVVPVLAVLLLLPPSAVELAIPPLPLPLALARPNVAKGGWYGPAIIYLFCRPSFTKVIICYVGVRLPLQRI